MKKYSFLLLSILLLAACQTQKPSSVADMAVLQTHKKVAILPFDVDFSDQYLQVVYNRKRNREQSFEEFAWEQKRLAGLDLQADMYKALAKKIEKGKLSLPIMDFLQTNKLLAENNVPMNMIFTMNKQELARILQVDAVISGTSLIEVDRPNLNRMMLATPFGFGGVTTDVFITDRQTGQVAWKSQFSLRPSQMMDTPAFLATSTVTTIAKRIPYK